jgi:hypothetical protein
MKQVIKIKGEEWPLDFSMTTLALFARDEKKGLSELLQGMQFDLLGIIKLFYWAIKEGCERNKKGLPEDFDWKTVGDWVNEDPSLAGQVLSEYYLSQGLEITEEESEEVKKMEA